MRFLKFVVLAIVQLFIPGMGHVLIGRYRAGLSWLGVQLAIYSLIFGLFPFFSYLFIPANILCIAHLGFNYFTKK